MGAATAVLDGCPCGRDLVPAASNARISAKLAFEKVSGQSPPTAIEEESPLDADGLPAAAKPAGAFLSAWQPDEVYVEKAKLAVETTRNAADVALRFAGIRTEGDQDGHDWDEELESDGQVHLFKFHDKLTTAEQELLTQSMEAFTDSELDQSFTEAMDRREARPAAIVNAEAPNDLNWPLRGTPSLKEGANCTHLDGATARNVDRWQDAGLELFQDGTAAIIVLAGGDNSRFRMSEGIYFDGIPATAALNFGLLSHKSLFQLFCERIRRLEHLATRRYQQYINMVIDVDSKAARRKGWLTQTGNPSYPKSRPIPIYIMVNEDNRDHAEEFFKDHNFFGLDPKNVMLFAQDNYPVMSVRGKVLLENKFTVIKRPNGSGGLFRALQAEGVVPDLKVRGIQHLFVMAGDNILARVGDPIFMGFFAMLQARMGLKVLERSDPHDHFGIFVTEKEEVCEDADQDGELELVEKRRPGVFEFYELDEKARTRRRPDKKRFYHYAGNMCQYYFSVEAAHHAHHETEWHAVDYWSSFYSTVRDEVVRPPRGEANAIRLEMLVTDPFECHKKVASLCVDRTSQYAIIRSPIDAVMGVAALSLLHQSWITSVGGKFEKRLVAGLGHDQRCEVSPLVSYLGESLESCFKTLHLPLHLTAAIEQKEEEHKEEEPEVGVNLADVRFRNAQLKFTPWTSMSEESGLFTRQPSSADRKLSQESAKSVPREAFLERAPPQERLCTTPRWLSDMEDHWQEALDAKMAEYYLVQEQEAEKNDESSGKQRLRMQMEMEMKKEEQKRQQDERKKTHLEDHHGSGHQAACAQRGNKKWHKTMPFRPEKEDHHDDDHPVVYGTVSYFRAPVASGHPGDQASPRGGRRTQGAGDDGDYDDDG